MVTPRSLIFAASAAVFVACGSSDAPSATSGSPPANDGGSATDGADASQAPAPILPYPPGPYSAEMGGVISDFRVQGYALSPSQRDSRKLPFRDITLSEVRSTPGCTCLMIIWTAAGQNCNPCVEADNGMTAAVARDPSFCVLEILSTSFDTFGPNGSSYLQPPTRADLDAFTQSNRENYPVGLITDGAAAALSAGVISGIPTEFVVRVSDMRLVGFILGRHNDLDREAQRYCSGTTNRVETLATGIAPRAIVADDAFVYVADASSTIVRVPFAGGAVEPVAPTAGVPDHLVHDGLSGSIVWASQVSTTSFVVERATKGTNVTVTPVATSPSEITSLATDGARVYFTRADGVVASASASGGTVDVLATGEADPTSILVDSTYVHWLAKSTGEVVQMPKAGGERRTLFPSSTRKRAQILRGADDVIVREESNSGRNTFLAYRLTEGTVTELMPDFGNVGRASIDVAAGNVDFVLRSGVFGAGRNDEGISHFLLQADGNGNRWANYYTAGQTDVVDIASRDSYAIWATNAPTGGTLKRIRR